MQDVKSLYQNINKKGDNGAYEELVKHISNKDLGLKNTLDELASLKAYIQKQCATIWGWTCIGILLTFLSANILPFIDSGKWVSLCVIIGIFLLLCFGAINRLFHHSKNQQLLSIVESVEFDYKNGYIPFNIQKPSEASKSLLESDDVTYMITVHKN